MRIASIHYENGVAAAIVTDKGAVPVKLLKVTGSDDLMDLISSGELKTLTEWYNGGGREMLDDPGLMIPASEIRYAPLLARPRHIFGIGLNYSEHAADIGAPPPQSFPGSFFKSPETVIGYGEYIKLPDIKESQRVTAEGELGVIMGKDIRDVSEENWLDAVAGFTCVLDMTEESILKGNDYLKGDPRYLTLVKNFPTFFSFGPVMVTPDEISDISKLEVVSVINGREHRRAPVAKMTHSPARLVSLHSSIQGWYAGDVLSTGTPGAFPIEDGDTAQCDIYFEDGSLLGTLKNPVRK